MHPLEKYVSNCTVVVCTTQEQLQREQNIQPNYDISLSEFSEIYNEYLSDHSEAETQSTSTTHSDTDSTSTSASITKLNNQKIQEDFENLKNSQNRNKLNKNQHLFGVQLEVNFLLLEAERRKLRVLQQELRRTLDDCDKKYTKSKHSQEQCQELIVAIS
jgi:hypothetical protein